jgi:hypothetical protein
METRITFNGQTYDSIENMPPEVREQYQAVLNALSGEDHAEVASLLEGGAGIRIKTTVRRKIRVGGKDYDSVDQLPPELRAAYERATGQAAGGLPASAPVITSSIPAPTDREGSAVGTIFRIVLFVAMGAIVLVWLLLRH